MVELWKFHQKKPSVLNDRTAAEAIKEILEFLAKVFPTNEPQEDHQTAAWTCPNENACACYQFLIAGKTTPSYIRSSNMLISKAKKYLAEKNNPVQYEMNDILNEALHELKDNGEVEFDKVSADSNRLTKFSSVALKNTPEWKKASMDDYETNRGLVNTFSMKVRGNSPEKSRMLAPKDAVVLVRQLLTAFGGWVKKPDLLKAMKNHIPEQMQIVPEMPRNEDDDSAGKADNYADNHDYIEDFDGKQAVRVIEVTKEKIWEEICKVSNKVFCLYYLPDLAKLEVNMQDLGKTSTVHDQNEKIKGIMRRAIKSPFLFIGNEEKKLSETAKELCQGYKMSIMRTIVGKIHKGLVGKCTESGHDPYKNHSAQGVCNHE